jgi:hypothetical protein
MNLADLLTWEERTCPSPEPTRITPALWLAWRLHDGPTPLLTVFAEAARLGFSVAETRRALDEAAELVRPPP